MTAFDKNIGSLYHNVISRVNFVDYVTIIFATVNFILGYVSKLQRIAKPRVQQMYFGEPRFNRSIMTAKLH